MDESDIAVDPWKAPTASLPALLLFAVLPPSLEYFFVFV